ncbi:multidrug transporter subunit MdtA [Legionella qingyii]|uniref:Efflux RND transporter periplasmic adaptor subunit n=1 Tax=Legionella qingyii TaxID=2184757 RepID=A0A317U3Q8_9GAMM|nr:efflux RND transporter periplasmic adaptor subunit [Legionella qingyii]PWY54980.1 multidrug transporter subunit MdtA [Legionella qingyii]RUR21019.1 efflux RND transporter periplasmic adaptor subunit [Legionella qingyii]RUR27890.1 efflux RND transporter periplasmic adaptor subunit [Legionella qingyii]
MEGEKSPAKNKKMVISDRWREHFPAENSLGVIIILVTLVAVLWFYISNKKTHNVSPKPIPVVAGISTTRDVPIYVAALGTVTPVYTVTVQTQINGLLMNVLFKEGQLVKKGQLLAQIDKRPYEALLTQYEGDLKRDSALLANAKIDLNRYQKLWKEDSISQQTLATQQSLVEQYEGNVKADLGLIQSTKVNLIYCNIISPIDGRIGLRLVDPGNFVQTSNTQGIAVITTHDPITVIFPVAEDYVPLIAPQAYAGKEMEVNVYDRQQDHLLAKGTLLALDNQISTSTGTVKLRAIFNNKKNKLFPNQFVNVKILVETLHQATVVPTAALQHTTTEDFIYVLNEDNTVKIQTVVMGPASGDDTVIKRGLLPGQKVVVNGADKLMNGSKVLVQNEHASSVPVQKSQKGLKVNSFT